MSLSFEKSLKPLLIEERVDYYFYRRVAHLLVPFFYRLKISPNQVTTLSLISGLIASWFVLNLHMVWGTIFGICAIFLDCSDGQLARLTGTAGPLGRAMDGFFDLVWIAALWLAVYFSGYFNSSKILWLMIPAATSMIFHCWRFEGARVQYFKFTDPIAEQKNLSLSEAVALMKIEAKKFNLPSAFLAFCIAFQMYFFVPNKALQKPVVYPEIIRARFKQILDPAISLWPWLGEGLHNTLVLVGILLATLTPYGLIATFFIILIPMNFYWIYCEWKWNKAVKAVHAIC